MLPAVDPFHTGSGALHRSRDHRSRSTVPRDHGARVVHRMALLVRYVNFIKEEEARNSAEGKFGGGIPMFNGEPTRLGEYTWRVRATPGS